MIIWNPWHGCNRVSEGCAHCYMYTLDARRGIDTSRVYRTRNFDLPLARTPLLAGHRRSRQKCSFSGFWQ